MLLKCYILDDEPDAIHIIRDYIEKSPILKLVGHNTNPIEALQEIPLLDIDILFLDINMPHLNGIKVAELLDADIIKIFTTAYSEHAYNAFDNHASGYLLKPITFEKFMKCIYSIQSILERKTSESTSANDYIYVSQGTKSKITRVALNDIDYIESNNNSVVVNSAGSQYQIYIRLKEVIKWLPKEDFIRIHKSFIVNQSKISQIDGNRIILKDKTILLLGNLYKEDFYKLIQPNIIGRTD